MVSLPTHLPGELGNLDEDGLPVLMPETHAGLQHSAAKTADLREFLAARQAGPVLDEAAEVCSGQNCRQLLGRRKGTGRTARERKFSLRLG